MSLKGLPLYNSEDTTDLLIGNVNGHPLARSSAADSSSAAILSPFSRMTFVASASSAAGHASSTSPELLAEDLEAQQGGCFIS
jgi:hypothetical protein